MSTSNQFVYDSPILNDLYAQSPNARTDASQRRLNQDWIADSFFSPRSEMLSTTGEWAFMSSADHKFTDSQWGGNFAINTRPQYTPLSDPRRVGVYLDRKSIFDIETDPIMDIRNLGMGRVYSEQYDDNAHRVYFRFGVPQYNSLTRFLENMSSSEAVSLATTGSSSRISRIVGALIATRFIYAVSPITSVLFFLSAGARSIFQNKLLAGTNQFYTLKSVQGTYWNTVQSMVNEYMVATNMIQYEGLVSKGWDYLTGANTKEDKRESIKPDTGARENLKYIASLLPEVFDENYGFNVVKLVGKTGRRSVAYMEDTTEVTFSLTKNLLGGDRLISYREAVVDAVRRRANGQKELLRDGQSRADRDAEITENLLKLGASVIESADIGVTKEDVELAIRSYHATALWFTAIQSVWFNPTRLGEATLESIYSTGKAVTDNIINAFTSSSGQESATTGNDALNIAAQAVKSQDYASHVRGHLPLDSLQAGTIAAQKTSLAKEAEANANSFFNHMDYSLKFGLEFVQFEVSYSPQVQEGVSNNVQPAPLGEMLRGIAGSARTFKNMIANGNLGDGAISSIIETVAGVAGGVISGGVSLLTMGSSDGLLDVIQGAQIDMPQFWESSNAQLPVATYTMQLRAGGGDFLSELKGVYLPLFCLIAGSFPQAVGESSHVHPFYCQVFDKGRLTKPCAMITNITISRGVGNLAFDENWKGLAIDVTFDVTDLTPVMAVPAMPGMLVPGHPMTNYIWTLASTELDVYINGLTSMSNAVERLSRRFNSIFDKANLANMAAQMIKGNTLRYIIIPSYAHGLATDGYSNVLDPRR